MSQATKMKIKRISLGKTQSGLTDETGIPQWRLSLIERGIPPTQDEKYKISRALGVLERDIWPES